MCITECGRNENDAGVANRNGVALLFSFFLTHTHTHTPHHVLCVLAGATAAQPHPPSLPLQTRGFWRAYVVGHAVRPSHSLTAATPTRDPRIPISRATPEITLRVTSLSALWNPPGWCTTMPTRSGRMYFDACIDEAGRQLPVAEMDGFPAWVFAPFFFLFLRYHPLSCPKLVLKPDPVTF